MSPRRRLYTSVGSFSFLSLSSYYNVANEGILFVACLCAFSSTSASFQVWIGHTGAAYSRWDITIVLYKARDISSSMYSKVLCISEYEISVAVFTQNSTSKSRARSYENLMDVVVSGNFLSILTWSCFVRGMAIGGCSTAEALAKHCLSNAQALPKHGKIRLSVMSR